MVVAGQVARLDETRRSAEEDASEAELATGEHDNILARLRERVDAEPFRERRWAQLMSAYIGRGDRQRHCVPTRRPIAYLARSWGGTRSRFQRIEEQILLHDTVLLLPASPPDDSRSLCVLGSEPTSGSPPPLRCRDRRRPSEGQARFTRHSRAAAVGNDVTFGGALGDDSKMSDRGGG